MNVKEKKTISVGLIAAILLPLVLIGLFFLTRRSRAVMDLWVFSILRPVAQAVGRLWSVVPFSGMEVLIVLCLAGSVLWLIRGLVLVIGQRDGRAFLRRILALAAVWLWLWCGLCWLWNVAYYASTFTQRSGLSREPYSVEQLARVTEYFAEQAARLSARVPRDEEGHFAQTWRESIEHGPGVYENLVKIFPDLDMHGVKVKPLVCSRLQSILGFTGMYFPFTGEANIIVDAPACLIPVTIAHEMAHQRMVSSELEANFVGIAASVTGDDVVFQYSGYLHGLLELSNALYPVDKQRWNTVVKTYFTQELVTDWNDNHNYWKALESPVEDAAGQAYDSFLKENGQELGMKSYGACVDLLVNWFGPLAEG